MRQYEDDLKEIKVISQSIQPDVITGKDAEVEIKRHEEEELRTERMLGRRFLTEIDDSEAGSTISAINERHQPELMMKQFLEEMQEQVKDATESEKMQKRM